MTTLACLLALAAGTADAKGNRGDPCTGRGTTSLSVNNPKCKPKNPPPVVEGPDSTSTTMGHGGAKGGAGSGGGGKGHGGGGKGKGG